MLSVCRKATPWTEEQDIRFYRPACTEQDLIAFISGVYVTRSVQKLTSNTSINKCSQ
jgi:hypothetical protein